MKNFTRVVRAVVRFRRRIGGNCGERQDERSE
jgi:hypothetical protein